MLSLFIMSSRDVQETVRQHKMKQHIMDPIFPQLYSMDSIKFDQIIKVNLEFIHLFFTKKCENLFFLLSKVLYNNIQSVWKTLSKQFLSQI